MKRCFELALKGFGQVAPNPMVGCVIVKGNEVITEGYHKAFGEAHVLELRARIDRRRVELDDAVDGIFHRAGEHFAIRNVEQALAHFRFETPEAAALAQWPR